MTIEQDVAGHETVEIVARLDEAGLNGVQPQVPVQEFNNTDVGNANRLAARFKSELRWVPDWHTWVHYDGIRWAKVSEDVVLGLGKLVLSEMKDQARELESNKTTEDRGHRLGAWAYASEKGYHLDRMVEYAKPDLLAYPNDFDQDPWLFNALDCTIDLQTGLTHPHNSKDMITKVAGTTYDTDVDGGLFYKFINDITGKDVGVAEYIQEVLGYALTGDTSEKHVWFPYGGGDNGKSVLLEITGDVMGDYADVGYTKDIIDRGNWTQSTWSIAKLVGVRRASFAELQPGDKLDWTVLKQMTGGDTMSVREIYGKPISTRMYAKIFIPTNDLPTVEQVSDAEWGRIKVIPFKECFIHGRDDCHEPDHELMPKLRSLLPAILRWLVGGELLRREYGLIEPKAVTDATKRFQEESDTLAEFLEACTYRERGAKTKLRDIYAAYQEWYEGDRYDVPKDSEIGKQLRGHGYQGKTIRGVSHYLDISLRPGYIPVQLAPFQRATFQQPDDDEQENPSDHASTDPTGDDVDLD